MILTPGTSSGARRVHLPGETDPPRVDDYLDPAEVTRYERVGGRRQLASPATEQHGDPHFHLDQLLGPHLAEGYVGSVDLKTRVDVKQEFASDTCVRRSGIDPETGSRYLEELVFEIVYERSLQDTNARAQALAERGVRRQIAIFVKSGKVQEWSAASQGWRELDLRRSLQDPCLVEPLPLRALFDAARAEVAMARVLEAKSNPAIVEMKERSKAEGRAEGVREGLAISVLAILEARGFTPPEETRRRILDTADQATLDRWVRLAVTASSLDDMLGVE